MFVALLTFGAAVGRSRPAAYALGAIGLVVLFVALALDRPTLDDKRGLEVFVGDEGTEPRGRLHARADRGRARAARVRRGAPARAAAAGGALEAARSYSGPLVGSGDEPPAGVNVSVPRDSNSLRWLQVSPERSCFVYSKVTD